MSDGGEAKRVMPIVADANNFKLFITKNIYNNQHIIIIHVITTRGK